MTRPWLRNLSLATVAGTFGMLTLGALVTSFKAGMADTTWPRTPWHLFTIEWENWLLWIEHAHRFTGYMLGSMMTVLAIGLWAYEPNRRLRLAGLASLFAVLLSAGLGMWLLRAKGATGPAAGLNPLSIAEDSPALQWIVAAAAALSMLGLAAVLFSVIRDGKPGRWLRLCAVAMLLAVVIQGFLGGFRVKFVAIFGDDFAAIHGAFSQIVLGLTVLTAMAAAAPVESSESRRMHAESTARLDRWALVTAALIYLQILAGVALRHSNSSLGWLGPRAHLWFVFPAVVVACGTAWRLLHTAAPPSVRKLAYLMLGLIFVQLLLGVESWLARFSNGFVASTLTPITTQDAVLRSVHAVTGYALFATAVALAYQTRKPAIESRQHSLTFAELETVA